MKRTAPSELHSHPRLARRLPPRFWMKRTAPSEFHAISIRQFTPKGIAAFREFLEQLRQTPNHPIEWEMLYDKQLTQEVTPTALVEPRRLVTKQDAADYLEPRLRSYSMDMLRYNAGLWSWLTLFFFDSICPMNEQGVRVVRNDYHYVFEAKNSQRYYFHNLFISWYIRSIAGQYTRLFLGGSVSVLDGIINDTLGRLFLIRIPCMFEVLDRLYWDETKGRPRIGMIGTQRPKPGDLTYRLPRRIRQLEKTYDLPSLNADQLIALLGAEFDF